MAVAVLAGLLVPTAAQAAPETAAPRTAGPCSSGSVLVLESFHVVAKPAKKVVRRGEKVVVTMTVTRPAHKDPLGLGVEYDPPTSTPEPDAYTGLSVWTGERTYFWQTGMTNQDGVSKLTLTVPKNAELGDAYVTASAYKWLKRDCPDIMETGFTEYERFFTVVP